MKKLIITAMIVSLSTICFGQIGAALGYGSGKATIESGGISINGESASTFSIGLVYDAEIADKLDLQPNLSFGIGEKFEDPTTFEEKPNNAIGLGTTLQFYVAGRDVGFSINGGLNWAKSLYDYENGDDDGIKTAGFGMGLGLGYDITEALNINASYGRSLTNYSDIDGIKLRSQSVGVSIQYLFN